MRHCADLKVDVEWEDLGMQRRGEYHPDDNAILLSPRLTRRQAISSLAHELGHERFGDTCSTPSNERRAWEYGAALLITPDEYQAAESLVGHHLSALAAELDVTPKLIEAWRRWFRLRYPWVAEQAQQQATPWT